MEAQTLEARIREVDETILRVGGESAEILKNGPSLRALDERARFIGVLMRRRACLLSDYAQQGGNVKGLYTFDAVIGGD